MSDAAISAPAGTEQTPNRPKAPRTAFKPGKSGNPRGRPPGVKRLIARELLAPHAQGFAEALLDVAQHGRQELARVEACKLAFAYFSGPPPAEPLKQDPPAPAQPVSLDEARRLVAAPPAPTEGVAA